MFKKLVWDSEFFGFPVAQICETADLISDDKIFIELFYQNIRLAYFFSPAKFEFPENDFYEIKLVDEKVTFAKPIQKHEVNPHISVYEKSYPEQQLISLAIESGAYSRFKVDEKIGLQKFEQLYSQWITNSVLKKIADTVLVYEENSQVNGLLTIGQKNNIADIGIIAVDHAARKKGIGKSLIRAAENFSSEKHSFIQVVTQARNIPACRLYTSVGFTSERTSYIYHLWKK